MQRFTVKGMTSKHCASAITEGIQYVDPGARVTVDLEAGTVVVADETAPQDVILEAIAKEGFEAVPNEA